MRRRVMLIVLAASALASALAGCGSSSSGSSSPAGAELSYLPPNSPFVMTIETDPNGAAIKGANDLASRFPLASFGEAALKAKLQQSGINYDADLHPLFGNPIAIAVLAPKISGLSKTQALIVWVTKDGSKLKDLIKKTAPGVHAAGSRDGATLYESSGSWAFAIAGNTLIAASSTDILNAALDRHAHGGGITSRQYSNALAGLPANALVKAFGDLSSVLSHPSAANARSVPWVAAFKAYSATMTASSSGLTFDYHLDTTGAPLSASQLPFAPGTTPPGLAGTNPITVGIHDPAQIAAFIESAQRMASTASYANFLKRQAATRAKTGVDLNSLIRLLTGELIVSSDTKTTMGRATVSDPAAAATTLAKLARARRGITSTKSKVVSLGSGFYAITEGRGSTVVIGLVGNQLVVGKATPAQLRAFAAAPTTPAAGAKGTVAFRIGLAPLLALAMHKSQPPQAAQAILNSLSDITGWLSSSTTGITGNATIGLK